MWWADQEARQDLVTSDIERGAGNKARQSNNNDGSFLVCAWPAVRRQQS